MSGFLFFQLVAHNINLIDWNLRFVCTFTGFLIRGYIFFEGTKERYHVVSFRGAHLINQANQSEGPRTGRGDDKQSRTWERATNHSLIFHEIQSIDLNCRRTKILGKDWFVKLKII